MEKSHAFIPSHTVAKILCCECGVTIEPNSANMCISCIRSKVDITEGITRQLAVNFCRGCERYLQPPSQWLACQLESRELLALLLRRIKGLNRVRLVDASFVWTEPHSRRLRINITIQKEVLAATILQQTVPVEAVVVNQQCSDCARREAKNTWNTVVQVRQKVPHKRTFLFLEQLILKHQAHRDTVNIKPVREGIDFFFGHRNHALRFVDFLQAVVPIRTKSSEQLITQDVHSGSSTYKFTYSVEIVPICKDDLIFLPPKVARSLGSISPLLLCTKIGTTLHFIDPSTLAVAHIPSNPNYWRDPFEALAGYRDLVDFHVLDVELTDRVQGKNNCLADVTVARSSDFGRNNTTFHTRTHLGFILKPGDMVKGYDLTTSNWNHDDFTTYFSPSSRHHNQLPDVILVRKSYDHLRQAGRRRTWKLKQLAMDIDDGAGPRNTATEIGEDDRERFMQELEEDQEMRSAINLYRDRCQTHHNKHGHNNDSNSNTMDVDDITKATEDEDVPKVSLEELLDDLTLSEAE